MFVPLLVAASRRAGPEALPQAASALIAPVEAGKSYRFSSSGSEITGTVVVESQGGWVCSFAKQRWTTRLVLNGPSFPKRGPCVSATNLTVSECRNGSRVPLLGPVLYFGVAGDARVFHSHWSL
jgi:hypothetical protein